MWTEGKRKIRKEGRKEMRTINNSATLTFRGGGGGGAVCG